MYTDTYKMTTKTSIISTVYKLIIYNMYIYLQFFGIGMSIDKTILEYIYK